MLSKLLKPILSATRPSFSFRLHHHMASINTALLQNKLFIAGKFVPAEGNATFDVVNPANEEVFIKMASASKSGLFYLILIFMGVYAIIVLYVLLLLL